MEGARGTMPSKIFLAPLLAPQFSRKVQIFDYIVYCKYRILLYCTCEVRRCTRNEHDTSRLLLCFNLYKTFSSFLCLLALHVSKNV